MPVFVATIRVSRDEVPVRGQAVANIAVVAATNRPSPAHHAARVYRSRRTREAGQAPGAGEVGRCGRAHRRHTPSRTADRSSWSP